MTSTIRRHARAAASALALVLAVLAPTGADAQRPATTPGGGAASSVTLAQRVNAVVCRAPLDRAHWGIVVQDARTAEVLYERNADRLFIPASNLKLVVATAAAHLLPADFRLRTSLYATGPLEDGV